MPVTTNPTTKKRQNDPSRIGANAIKFELNNPAWQSNSKVGSRYSVEKNLAQYTWKRRSEGGLSSREIEPLPILGSRGDFNLNPIAKIKPPLPGEEKPTIQYANRNKRKIRYKSAKASEGALKRNNWVVYVQSAMQFLNDKLSIPPIKYPEAISDPVLQAMYHAQEGDEPSPIHPAIYIMCSPKSSDYWVRVVAEYLQLNQNYFSENRNEVLSNWRNFCDTHDFDQGKQYNKWDRFGDHENDLNQFILDRENMINNPTIINPSQRRINSEIEARLPGAPINSQQTPKTPKSSSSNMTPLSFSSTTNRPKNSSARNLFGTSSPAIDTPLTPDQGFDNTGWDGTPIRHEVMDNNHLYLDVKKEYTHKLDKHNNVKLYQAKMVDFKKLVNDIPDIPATVSFAFDMNDPFISPRKFSDPPKISLLTWINRVGSVVYFGKPCNNFKEKMQSSLFDIDDVADRDFVEIIFTCLFVFLSYTNFTNIEKKILLPPDFIDSLDNFNSSPQMVQSLLLNTKCYTIYMDKKYPNIATIMILIRDEENKTIDIYLDHVIPSDTDFKNIQNEIISPFQIFALRLRDTLPHMFPATMTINIHSNNVMKVERPLSVTQYAVFHFYKLLDGTRSDPPLTARPNHVNVFVYNVMCIILFFAISFPESHRKQVTSNNKVPMMRNNALVISIVFNKASVNTPTSNKQKEDDFMENNQSTTTSTKTTKKDPVPNQVPEVKSKQIRNKQNIIPRAKSTRQRKEKEIYTPS